MNGMENKGGGEWNVSITIGSQDHSQSLKKPQHHKIAVKRARESTSCRNAGAQSYDNPEPKIRPLKPQKKTDAEMQEDELLH